MSETDLRNWNEKIEDRVTKLEQENQRLQDIINRKRIDTNQSRKLRQKNKKLREVLIKLADNWKRDGEFLRNPDDDPADRMCGKVFLDCAEELRSIAQNKE